MQNPKPVFLILSTNCKLRGNQCKKSKVEKPVMSKVPYASAVGSLMYAIVCTRADIAYVVEVVT